MQAREIPSTRSLLETLLKLVPEAYVVGGAVRDPLLGSPAPADVDLAVKGDGYAIARELASAFGSAATFVPLDRSTGTGRLVLLNEMHTTLDIATFKGPSLHDDLFARDFTINALALTIPDFLRGDFHHPIDPTGGLDDLREGVIRACGGSAFRSDPLRILRAFRFRADLGFRISPETGNLMAENVLGLSDVSPERIRDELFAILAADDATEALAEMDAMSVLDAVFPEAKPMKGCQQNRYHHLDVWNHTLEALRGLEDIIKRPEAFLGETAGQVATYLSQEPVAGRSRRALLKLALLFHDSGKPQSMTVDETGRIRFFGHEAVSRQLFEAAANRLKLARREIKLIAEWIGGHMRTMIFTKDTISARATFRLHRAYGEDLMGLLVLFLADLSASQGPARDPGSLELAQPRVRECLQQVLDARDAPRPPLLNGRDIMEAFGVAPGPGLGALLGRIEELQGTGEIGTREEALAAVERIMAEVSAEGEPQNPKAR